MQKPNLKCFLCFKGGPDERNLISRQNSTKLDYLAGQFANQAHTFHIIDTIPIFHNQNPLDKQKAF